MRMIRPVYLVVRCHEVPERRQFGEVVEDRQLVERDVDARQLSQLEQLARQLLPTQPTQHDIYDWTSCPRPRTEVRPTALPFFLPHANP